MLKEIERKYLLSQNAAEKLLNEFKDAKTVGIAQWYDEEANEKVEIRRVRLEIYRERTGFRHEWTESFKSNSDDPEVRNERERTLDPMDPKIDFKKLESMKSVFKIRHILKKDPEIVLDEFVEIDKDEMKNPKKTGLPSVEGKEIRFLLEIERRENPCDFKKEIEFLNIQDAVSDVTEDKNRSYDNFHLAFHNNLSPYRVIEFLQNRLLGPVTVIAMQGISIASKFGNEKREEILTNENFLEENLDLTYGEVKIRDILSGKIEEYSQINKLSAELDSIDLLLKKGFLIDEVLYILFPKDGKSKNKIPPIFITLEKLTKAIFHVKNVRKKLLNYVSSDEESVLKSVQELWEILKENFNRKNKVIVDVAGGQKYPSIVAALYCLLNNKEFYYKQDKSDVITKFPPVPISWNFNLLDENLSAFKLASNKSSLRFKYENYLSLPGFFKDLFDLSSRLGINTTLPLDEIFERYNEARKMPFGYGQRFIELINDEKMKKFIKEKISKKWNLMWIGDQIPETVEHSQRHSKRLMEFTVNLINTIGEEAFLKGVPENLTNEFYFVLGVAMNVHDLGHTALSYIMNDGRRIALDGLPSIVRDLHNELSYQMLTKEKDKYELLKGIEELKNGEKLARAIALVSRYHRNHMPIVEVMPKAFEKNYVRIFKLEIIPLKKVVEKEFENEKDWQNLTIMASRWLKFIDGTDVQADRTVMKEYNKMRTWRTKMEVLSLCEDILGNVEFWKNEKFLSFKNEIEEIMELAKDAEKNSITLEKKSENIEREIYGILDKVIQAKESQIIVDEYVKKIDKIAFKARQFPHFKKHQIIQSIYPRFYNRKSFDKEHRNVLHISINCDESYSQEEKSRVLDDVKRDIRKEFKNAGLSNNGIKSIEFD